MSVLPGLSGGLSSDPIPVSRVKKSFLFCALKRPKSRKFQFLSKILDLPLYKIEISGIIIIVRCASVAQSVEQGTENPRVIGSIPIGGTSQGDPAGFPICGRSSSGRAPPCQGGGSEFEPRRPLQQEWFSLLNMVTWPRGKARVCKTLIHQFKSGRHLQKIPGSFGFRDFSFCGVPGMILAGLAGFANGKVLQ